MASSRSGRATNLRSIGTSLLIWVASLTTLGFGLFGLLFYFTILRPTVDDLAASRMRTTAIQVVEHVAKLNGQLERVALTARDWGAAQAFEMTSIKGFVRLFIPVMRARAQISGVLFANDKGEEIYLHRGPDGGWRTRITNVEEWGNRQMILHWREPDVLLGQDWQEREYDPRRRPWFEGAMTLSGERPEVFWTEPYIFFTAKTPGITIASRWNDDGAGNVVAFDVELLDLSRFTQGIDLGRDGRAAILAGDGGLLAAPRHPSLVLDEDIKRASLKSPAEVGLEVIAPAFDLWNRKGRSAERVDQFEVDGKTWLGMFLPIRMANREFVTVTVAPLEDFVPGSARHAWLLFGLTAFIATVAVLTTRIFAGRLRRPLVALARESERIGMLKLDQPVAIDTRWREFRVLADAQDHMRQLLEAAKEDLDAKVGEMRKEREAAIKLALEAQQARKAVAEKMAEVERFNRLAVGREQRMIELKTQVNELSKALGRESAYLVPVPGDAADGQEAPADGTTLDAKAISTRFKEILDANNLNALFEDFTASVGVAMAIIDLDAVVLASSRWQRACTDFHRVNPETCRRCIESDMELALKLQEDKDFSMYRCKNGMTDCASPIIVEGIHVANAFIGQFHTRTPDEAFFRAQAREVGLDEEAYLAAVREAPIVDEAKLPHILGFLAAFAKLIASFAVKSIRAEEGERAIRDERMAAMNLAEDAEKARADLAEYQKHLEKLVEDRTADLTVAEERSRLILDSAGEGIFGTDADGMVSFVNPAGTAMIGFAPEELLGRSIHPLIHHTRVDGAPYPIEECPMRLAVAEGRPGHVEDEVFWRKDGSSFPAEYSALPIVKDGLVTGSVITFRDVTERREAETRLREKMEELENFSKVAVGRELRMIRLKEEINALKARLGEPPAYEIAD
jgi:PAS domain S-box-containing protein